MHPDVAEHQWTGTGAEPRIDLMTALKRSLAQETGKPDGKQRWKSAADRRQRRRQIADVMSSIMRRRRGLIAVIGGFSCPEG